MEAEKKNGVDATKDWVNLGGYVHYLVEKKETEGPEFKALLAIYGREKLREVLRDEREKMKLDGKLK